MNKRAKDVMDLIDENPLFKGKFIGCKKLRGGLGVTRINNDWYQCEDYFISISNLKAVMEQQHKDMQQTENGFNDIFAYLDEANKEDEEKATEKRLLQFRVYQDGKGKFFIQYGKGRDRTAVYEFVAKVEECCVTCITELKGEEIISKCSRKEKVWITQGENTEVKK